MAVVSELEAHARSHRRPGYFKPKIIYDDEAALKRVERKGPKEEQCIFGCFPHGVVSFHHGILMTDTAGFLSKFPSLVAMRRRGQPMSTPAVRTNPNRT